MHFFIVQYKNCFAKWNETYFLVIYIRLLHPIFDAFLLFKNSLQTEMYLTSNNLMKGDAFFSLLSKNIASMASRACADCFYDH